MCRSYFSICGVCAGGILVEFLFEEGHVTSPLWEGFVANCPIRFADDCSLLSSLNFCYTVCGLLLRNLVKSGFSSVTGFMVLWLAVVVENGSRFCYQVYWELVIGWFEGGWKLVASDLSIRTKQLLKMI